MAQHHVIIGGGPAATNAVETMRIFDSEAKITLVSDEPAHSRMALPYWLAGKIPPEQTHTGDAAHFQKLGVDTRFGLRVASIDANAHPHGVAQCLIHIFEVREHVEGAPDSPFRIIFMGLRCSEQDHDAVTHKLVNGSVVPVHGFDHAIETLINQITEVVRTHGFTQLRES